MVPKGEPPERLLIDSHIRTDLIPLVSSCEKLNPRFRRIMRVFITVICPGDFISDAVCGRAEAEANE